MFRTTLEQAVKNAVENSCNSEYVTKEELESVLTAALEKIFYDRDFQRFIRDYIK